MTEWLSSLFGRTSGTETEPESAATRMSDDPNPESPANATQEDSIQMPSVKDRSVQDPSMQDPSTQDPSMQDPSGDEDPNPPATHGKPDSASAASASSETESGPISGITYTIQTKEEPNPRRPFAHGFVDGMEGVDRAVFERFLTQSSEQGRLQEKLDEVTGREERLREERDERIDREARIQEKKQRLQDLNEKANERRQEVQRLQDLVQSYDERPAPSSRRGGAETPTRSDTGPAKQRPSRGREHQETASRRSGTADGNADSQSHRDETVGAAPARGSLIYAVLYSIAGALFVAGDIIMSREVVSRALRLQGDLEPWIFAIGLAMLAVLMKPAYDRLVEKPYWKGDERWFRITIVGGTIAAALTLGVLGAFRADAFETNQEIARLQDKVATGVAGNTMSSAEATQLQEQIAQLQQSIAGSWLGFASFVLSGVLFAAAGAVCLGIGLRHTRDWYHRSVRPLFIAGGERIRSWWNRRQLTSRYEEARDAYREIRSRRDDVEARLEAEQKRLDCTRPLNEIRADLQDVRADKERLQATRWVGAGHQSIEAYRNGYEIADAAFVESSPNGRRRNGTRRRGDGAPRSDDVDGSPSPTEESSDPDDGTSDEAATETDSENTNTGNSTSSRRPFLAVRDAISRNQIS